MAKLKFIFPNLFLWLGIVAACLLIEDVAFLTSTPTGTLSDNNFYMLLVLALSSYTLMFLFEHIFNKTRIDYLLLGSLAIFLAGGLLAIWTFKDTNFFDDPSKAISFSFLEKTRLSLGFGMFVLTLYCILFIYTKNHFTLRSISFVLIIYIIIMIVTIIYSLATEIGKYKDLFLFGRYNTDIKSLFWNTNAFSGSLLMGICAAMLLNVIKKNAFSYIAIAVFFIEILITISVLSVIIATFALLLYFLLEIILSWKKHPTRSFIFLSVYISLIVTVVCLFSFAIAGVLGPISNFFTNIYREFANISFITFSNRVIIWQGAITLLSQDPLKLTFGYGYKISYKIINSYIAAIKPGTTVLLSTTHNGILQILLNFGVVGLALYTFILGYFVFAFFKLLKGHKRFAWINLSVGIIMLFYSIGESIILFNCNVQGILIGVVFYLPMIMKYKHIKHPEVTKALFATTYSTTALENRKVVKIASIIMFSLITAFTPLLTVKAVWENALLYKFFIVIEICLILAWLTVPYLVGQWHKDTTLKHFKLRLLFNILFIGGMFSLTSFLYFQFDRNWFNQYIYYVPAFFAFYLLIDMIYYSIIRKPSFKDYLATFTGIFKNALPGIFISIGLSILLLYFYQGQIEFSALSFLIISIYGLMLYYGVNLFIQPKENKELVGYLNNIYVTFIKRQILAEQQKEARYV